MGNFQTDLEFGRRWEALAQKVCAERGEEIVDAPKGKCKEYDFKTDKATYEVKSDRYAYRTHCMFIEFECNGEPSGIATTTADKYFYFVVKPVSVAQFPENYDVYEIPVSELKNATPIGTKSGGDGWRVKGNIIPLGLFEAYKL